MAQYDKYNVYQVREFDGTNWTPLNQFNAYLTEEKSEDCGYQNNKIYEYRDTTESGCNGTNAYYIADLYVSEDSGQTWTPTGEHNYGTLIEENSEECGYSPCDTYFKYYLNLSDDVGEEHQTIVGSLTWGTLPGWIFYIELGSCVTSLSGYLYPCGDGSYEWLNAFRPDEWHSTTYGCRDNMGCINYIRIPTSVTSIGSASFYKINGTIEYQGTIAEWQNIDKASDWNRGLGTEYIICSNGKISVDGSEIIYD